VPPSGRLSGVAGADTATADGWQLVLGPVPEPRPAWVLRPARSALTILSIQIVLSRKVVPDLAL
jgi:hypothetical protein